METILKPGDRVSATYRDSHEETVQPWMAHFWVGTVLEGDDPRAWKGTLAFPCDDGHLPDTEKVKGHVAWCRAQGYKMSTPVLWDFGRVYFERAEDLYRVTSDAVSCTGNPLAWKQYRADRQAA